MTHKKEKPVITKAGILDIQVCVPNTWSDNEVISFANTENLCGTTGGWQIRRKGDELLKGDHERVPCSEREGFVHIMLDA